METLGSAYQTTTADPNDSKGSKAVCEAEGFELPGLHTLFYTVSVSMQNRPV